MKKRIENDLLNDVLLPEIDPAMREQSLASTLAAVTQARRRRTAVKLTAAGLVCFAAMLFLRTGEIEEPGMTRQAPPPVVAETVPGTNIRIIGDEELLALFPNRPVALSGSAKERQLVFLDGDPSIQN